MRIFAVPAALLLACCIYLPLPKAAGLFDRALRLFYDQTLRLFARKDGAADAAPALWFFLLLLCGISALLSAIHPLAAMVLMTPLFTGLSALPGCARIKDELDAGKYARDIPTYEALVRKTCASVAPSFAGGVVAPLILCAAGMPLHIACPLGYAYAALRALHPDHAAAKRILVSAQQAAERVLIFFMVLCSGVVGRNPLNTRGRSAEKRLMSILGITGDHGDSRAPMSGDITQAIFLCFFSTGVLCFALVAVGFVLCR